jgi:hypothetical protein
MNQLQLDSVLFGVWADVDLGDATDDLSWK